MNDDEPFILLRQLKADHRALDAEIKALIEAGTGDQLEVARLKKRKLHLKDQIQRLHDSSVPDLLA